MPKWFIVAHKNDGPVHGYRYVRDEAYVHEWEEVVDTAETDVEAVNKLLDLELVHEVMAL